MHMTVLAATGGTGRELVRQALERGHSVTALARDPSRVPPQPRLVVLPADVHDPDSLGGAISANTVVLSGLGAANGDTTTLTLGAQGMVAARPRRIIWLGAYGTGPSATAAGAATRVLLMLMRSQLADKIAADAAVLRSGGTVFHAGPMSSGPISTRRRTVGLDEAPRRFFPALVSRATVAAAMLDEAEEPRFPGAVALPLEE